MEAAMMVVSSRHEHLSYQAGQRAGRHEDARDMRVLKQQE